MNHLKLLSCLVVFGAAPAFAGGCLAQDTDDAWLSEVSVTTTTLIARFFIAKASPWPKTSFYSSSRLKGRRTCLLEPTDDPLPFELKCGIRPLAALYGDTSYGFDFLVAAVQDDKVALFMDPSHQKVAWYDRSSTKGFDVALVPFSQWFASVGYRPKRSGDEIPLFYKPSDGAPAIKKCPPIGRADKTNRLVNVVGLDSEESEAKSDWLPAVCTQEPVSFAPDQGVEAEAALQRAIEQGTHGWIRWRSPDGRLLVLPLPFFGCG